MKRRGLLFCIGLLVGALAFSLSTLYKEPSHTRNWSEEARILPDITIGSSTLGVKFLRDFRYDKDGIVQNTYYDDTFDLDKIDQAYFLINKFGFKEKIGHTFFVFTFTDGKELSVSVEARREVGVPYSAVKGLFNSYELWYIWGSPADFLSRRAVLLDDDLALYPLQISTSTARALILDLAQTTEELETEPRFYNSLIENCTNVLADSANRVSPDSVPWNWGRIITGLADQKLYDLGFIPNDKSFEEINREALIDNEIRGILKKNPLMDKDQFWRELSGRI